MFNDLWNIGQDLICVIASRASNSRARAYCACSRCGLGCLDIFTLVCPFSPLSPSLLETARYGLKYCLKGPLNPKTTKQINRASKIASMEHVLMTLFLLITQSLVPALLVILILYSMMPKLLIIFIDAFGRSSQMNLCSKLKTVFLEVT